MDDSNRLGPGVPGQDEEARLQPISQVWIVDAIRDDVARIEIDGGQVVTMPRMLLPSKAVEGDVLAVSLQRRADGAGLSLHLAVDPQATVARRVAAREQVSRLASKDSGGDLIL